jgi:hypothetical protein
MANSLGQNIGNANADEDVPANVKLFGYMLQVAAEFSRSEAKALHDAESRVWRSRPTCNRQAETSLAWLGFCNRAGSPMQTVCCAATRSKSIITDVRGRKDVFGFVLTVLAGPSPQDGGTVGC